MRLCMKRNYIRNVIICIIIQWIYVYSSIIIYILIYLRHYSIMTLNNCIILKVTLVGFKLILKTFKINVTEYAYFTVLSLGNKIWKIRNEENQIVRRKENYTYGYIFFSLKIFSNYIFNQRVFIYIYISHLRRDNDRHNSKYENVGKSKFIPTDRN